MSTPTHDLGASRSQERSSPEDSTQKFVELVKEAAEKLTAGRARRATSAGEGPALRPDTPGISVRSDIAKVIAAAASRDSRVPTKEPVEHIAGWKRPLGELVDALNELRRLKDDKEESDEWFGRAEETLDNRSAAAMRRLMNSADKLQGLWEQLGLGEE